MANDLDGVQVTGVRANGNGNVPNEKIVPTSVFSKDPEGNTVPYERPVYHAQTGTAASNVTNGSDMLEGTAETKIGGNNTVTPPPPPPTPQTSKGNTPPVVEPKPEVHFKNGTGVTINGKEAGVPPQHSTGGNPPVVEAKPEAKFKNGPGVTADEKEAAVPPQHSKGGNPPVVEEKPEAKFKNGPGVTTNEKEAAVPPQHSTDGNPPVVEEKPEAKFKNGPGVTADEKEAGVPPTENPPESLVKPKPKDDNTHANMTDANNRLGSALHNKKDGFNVGATYGVAGDGKNRFGGAGAHVGYRATNDSGVGVNVAGHINQNTYGAGARVSKNTESGADVGLTATYNTARKNVAENVAKHEGRVMADVGKDFDNGKTHVHGGVFVAAGKTGGGESFRTAGLSAGVSRDLGNGVTAGVNANADLLAKNVLRAVGASAFVQKQLTSNAKPNVDQMEFELRTPVKKHEVAEVDRSVSTVNLNLQSKELFQFDKHRLSQNGLQTLNSLARMLIDPNVVKGDSPNQTALHQMIASGQRITISGHTDFFGPDTYNQNLSAKRTEAVVGALSQYLSEYTKIPAAQVRTAFETRNVGEAEATYKSFKDAKNAMIAENHESARLKGAALRNAVIDFVAGDRKVAVGLPPVQNIDKDYVQRQYGNLGVQFTDGKPMTVKERQEVERVVGYNTISGYMPKGSQAPKTPEEAAKYTIQTQKYEAVNTGALENLKAQDKPATQDDQLKNKLQPS